MLESGIQDGLKNHWTQVREGSIPSIPILYMSGIKFIYEDDDVLVLNKPSGLLVHPTSKQEKGTLVDWLLGKYPKIKDVGDFRRDRSPCHGMGQARPVPTTTGGRQLWRPGIVHRLDKNTSGLMVVAKNQKAYNWLKKQFQERRVVKKYLALVYGQVKPEKGVIIRSIGRAKRDFRKKAVTDFLSGKRAKTRYQVLGYYGYYRDRSPCHGMGQARPVPIKEKKLPAAASSEQILSLLDVRIETGRTHQIRVHLASIGHPIVGDPLYKFKRQKAIPGLARQFLHAYYLELKLPSGQIKSFEIGLSEDLKSIINNKWQNLNVKSMSKFKI